MMVIYIILIIILIILIIFFLLYRYFSKNIYHTADTINSFFAKYCEKQPVFNPNNFTWSKNFRNNWKTIRDEYLSYSKFFVIPEHSKINNVVADCDKQNKWKTLYLRAFGKDTHVASYFPETMKIINTTPCALAFYSVLEPGAKLSPHVGIYKGVIRYHLGLIVPKQWDKCFIDVVGHKLHWQEGKDLMFDDMFQHYVENNTDETRVILFLDIKRDFHNLFLNSLNSLFIRFVKSNDVLNNTINNINSFVT